MLSLILLAALFASQAIGVTVSVSGKVASVHHFVSEADYNQQTSDDSAWIVEYFAPWCGHCQHLAPIFAESAKANPSVKHGAVDCTKLTALCKHHDISGYPTLAFTRNHERRSYGGARTLEGLSNYCAAMTAEPIKVIKSEKQFDRLLKGGEDDATRFGEVQFALFVPSQTQQKQQIKDAYARVAKAKQGLHHFGVVPLDRDNRLVEIAKEYNIEPDAQEAVLVALYENSREFVDFHVVDLSPAEKESAGSKDKDALTTALTKQMRSYVDLHSLPLLSRLNGENFDAITSGHTREFVVLLAMDFNDVDPVKELAGAEMVRLAKQFNEHAVFATVDGVKFAKYLSQYGVNSGADGYALPQIVALQFPDHFFVRPLSESQPTLTVSSMEEIKSFLDEVIIKRSVPVSALHPWYSPQKYIRQLERVMEGYDEMTVIFIVVAFSVLMLVLAAAVCWKSGLLGDASDITLTPAEAARAAGAVEGARATPAQLTEYEKQLGLTKSYAQALADKKADDVLAKTNTKPTVVSQQADDVDIRHRTKPAAASAAKADE